jgi:hypothetical protein
MILENLEFCQEGIEESIRNTKSIKVGEKEIHLLVKVVEIELTGFYAHYLEPIALVVIENDEKYLISINGEEHSSDLKNLVI